MATLPAERQSILAGLVERGGSAVKAIADRYGDPDSFLAAMLELYPALVWQLRDTAAELAAYWYEESDRALGYAAIVAPDAPPAEALQSNVRWALASGSTALWEEKLIGSMTRTVLNGARSTAIINASREGGATWARYASANACKFCRMLAIRGGVYWSEESALRVSGRSIGGSDYRKVERSGGGTPEMEHIASGRARRASTKRADGDRYHDNCKCMAVEVRPGHTYEPPAYVNDWQAQYTAARQNAGSGSTAAILAAWEQLAT